MKKIFFMLVLIVSLLLPTFAHAAGSCTVTDESAGSPLVHKLTYSCVCDASTGAIPSATSPYIYGWVFMVITTPGSTAPTSLYDLTLKDSNNIDIMNGALADRSSSAVEESRMGRYVGGALTLAGTNQSVNSATFTVVVYYYIEKSNI